MGTSCKRNQLGEVDVYFLVVNCVGVCGHRNVVLFSALSLEELESSLVGRENRGGSAELCAHVGDGSALRNGQALYALAGVLHYLANAALNGELTENFQDNVLCGNPVVELSSEVYLNDLRHSYVVSAAAHCNCNVKTACAHCQHADTAAGRGVAVGADKGLAGLAEALEMYLMADTVAGT